MFSAAPLVAIAAAFCSRCLAASLERPVALDATPDRSSEVRCIAWPEAPEGASEVLCALALRRRGRQVPQGQGRAQLLTLEVSASPAAQGDGLAVLWHRAPPEREEARSALQGASYAFRLHWPSRVAAEELELVVHVRLGRLHLQHRGRVLPACADAALWIGSVRCPHPAQGGQVLHAGITAAILDASGAVPGVAEAQRLWLHVGVGEVSNAQDITRRLNAPEAADAFSLSLHESFSQWIGAHAAHPRMHDQGSFIGPSESHPRGLVLPFAVAHRRPVGPVPTVTLRHALTGLLGGRGVELLEVWVPPGGSEEALDVLLSGGSALEQVATICVVGMRGKLAAALVSSASAHGVTLERSQQPPATLRPGSLCFQRTSAGSQGLPVAAGSSLLLLDKATQLGQHLQASAPVAPLDEYGRLEIPQHMQIWVEVGCNNWEMLYNELPPAERENIFLVTFEPLVDKFAFLRGLARSQPRHAVLPFAIAPEAMGGFVAIRSQNYTDFRGEPGRRFQESGASSLLPYAPGFRDHRWTSAPRQYKHFREYLVPTVTLEWVVDSLLGGRDIAHLKIDAQGLDYAVFASLGRHARKVARVQMELHTHVRHDGETPCPDVVGRMEGEHRFRVAEGRCAPFDSAVHDEADLVFVRE